ncbi:2-hydroxychromene-2-carboxylate isomerase [Falsiroseomonas sp.]|uniref:2-hydroxychromene-2-carboxylate isomerase n=1 Tax=Falsiroseomonas sp. TaxID=2870721 RepID=UPI003F6EC52B
MTPSAVTLDWYFDLVSPFAHLALPRVLALGGALGRPVTLKPIVLGAVLAHWGQLGPAEIAPKRRQTYRQVQFLGGRALRFPPAHPFRSLEALRLVTALGATPEVVSAAFAFIWAEGRDPVVEATAFAAQLGVEDAAALVAGTGAKERLRETTAEAIGRGVFGVPTLAVGDELFWGADAMPMAEAYLADPNLFETPAMRRLDALPMGVERVTR